MTSINITLHNSIVVNRILKNAIESAILIGGSAEYEEPNMELLKSLNERIIADNPFEISGDEGYELAMSLGDYYAYSELPDLERELLLNFAQQYIPALYDDLKNDNYLLKYTLKADDE